MRHSGASRGFQGEGDRKRSWRFSKNLRSRRNRERKGLWNWARGNKKVKRFRKSRKAINLRKSQNSIHLKRY